MKIQVLAFDKLRIHIMDQAAKKPSKKERKSYTMFACAPSIFMQDDTHKN